MFDEYPYTDLHNLNLDWFLDQFKKIGKHLADLKKMVLSAPDATNATAGQAPIADGAGGWAWGDMELDNTLSVSGKAADAKKTGDEISVLKSVLYGGSATNYVENKNLDQTSGELVDATGVCTSEFIPITWSGNAMYVCGDNTQAIYKIVLYDESKAILGAAFRLPSTTGGVDYRVVNADTQAVGGVAKFVRFSFKSGTIGRIGPNASTNYWIAESTSVDGIIDTVDELANTVNGFDDAIEETEKKVNDLNTGIISVSFAYHDGFIGGTGAITVPTANQEVYTNKVAVNEGDEINVSLQYDSARAMWFAYAMYDENETFKSRVALINGTASTYSGTITIGSGVKYVVFTFRTYGVATFNAYRTAAFYEELSGKIDTLDEKVDDIKPLLLSNTVKSIAHRGDDINAPQCTAPAYIIARKHGFEIAENDVWLSEDGYYVMEHDTTLSRLGNMVDINGYLMYTDGTDYYWVHPTTNEVYTYDYTNEEYVSSAVSLSGLTRCAGANYGVNSTYASTGLNLDVLKRIDFGVYKGSEFAGTQILTFEEWVLLCKQLGMEIYIDRKWAYTNEQIADLANIVKKYGMGDKASWLGMDGAKIIALRNIIPDSRCCLLQHPTEALIEAYTTYNTGRGFFFNGNRKTMTEESIQLGLNAGFDVEVWFVDYGTMTEEQILETIRTAVSYGVTGISLDHYRVDEAFEYLIDQY